MLFGSFWYLWFLFVRIAFKLLEAQIGLCLITITTTCMIAILLVGEWQILGIGTQSVQINRPFLSVVIDLGTPKPGRSATRKTLPESERSSARNNVGIHWSVLPKS